MPSTNACAPSVPLYLRLKTLILQKVLGPPVAAKVEAKLQGHDFYKVNYDVETLSEEEISPLKQVLKKLESPTF